MPQKQSNFKTLLNEKVKEITRNARTTVVRDRVPWFRRGDVMRVLANALEHKADTVVLDGQAFKIKYDGDRAKVSPADGSFVPCANFVVDVYLQEWEIYDSATRVTRLSDQN